jgi:hypothetical protein
MIAPPLKEIDGAIRGQVKVVKLNCNSGTAAKYDIMPIPTVDVVQERRACLGQIGGARSRSWSSGSARWYNGLRKNLCSATEDPAHDGHARGLR